MGNDLVTFIILVAATSFLYIWKRRDETLIACEQPAPIGSD